MQCVSTMRHCILFNGDHPRALFLRGTLTRGDIQRIKLTRSSHAITSLFFTDDSLLFIETSLKSSLRLKNLVEIFCTTSRQIITI